MNLLTPRLHLRAFEPGDINETYLGWLNDPMVTRFSNQRLRHHTVDSCAAYLASFQAGANSFLLIERREDQRSIGTASAATTTVANPSASQKFNPSLCIAQIAA